MLNHNLYPSLARWIIWAVSAAIMHLFQKCLILNRGNKKRSYIINCFFRLAALSSVCVIQVSFLIQLDSHQRRASQAPASFSLLFGQNMESINQLFISEPDTGNWWSLSCENCQLKNCQIYFLHRLPDHDDALRVFFSDLWSLLMIMKLKLFFDEILKTSYSVRAMRAFRPR